MLLLVVLSYLRRQTGPLQDINRKRKRGVAMPMSCESRQATEKKVTLGGTAVHHLEKAWLREREAAEFNPGKKKVSQSGANAFRTSL